MFKRLHVLFLLISLTSFVVACGESNTGEFRGSAITGTEEGGPGNVPGTGGTIGDGNNDETGAGNAPDDQTPDSNINNDFSSSFHLVGRYKITALKIEGPKGTLELQNAKDEVRGAFAVAPDMKSLAGTSIYIDMGIKFQFNPEIVTQYGLEEQEIIYVNSKLYKFVDLSNGLDFDKIFADLGAKIEGKVVYFTLKQPDMPVGKNVSVILTLEKVSDKADFTIVNDPREYWITGNAPEAPIEPEEPEITEPEIPIIPDVPTDEVVTEIDMNNPVTLTGNYQITRFMTVAHVGSFIGDVTVDSYNPEYVQEMKGHLSLNFTGNNMEAVSKMQMKAKVPMMEESDKYNYTVYEPFMVQENSLISNTDDPYKYSSAVITQLDEKTIQIKQKLKKNAIGSATDVDVTVIAQKVSDQPKEIVNCGYWTTSTVKKCNDDGSTIKNVDLNDPSTLTGHYKLINLGHTFNLPNSAGSTYENNWYSKPIAGMSNLHSDMTVKFNGTNINTSEFKVKYQINSSWYILYDKGGLLKTHFSDPRWKFFNETFSNPSTVEMEGTNLKVCIDRNFEYKFWKVEWLAWNNHWETTNPNVKVCFVAEKISDEPQEIHGDKYW